MADTLPNEAKGPDPDETVKECVPGRIELQSMSQEEDKRILRRIDL
jgi:hypothetical protein